MRDNERPTAATPVNAMDPSAQHREGSPRASETSSSLPPPVLGGDAEPPKPLDELAASWRREAVLCRESSESSTYYRAEDQGYAFAYDECADELAAALTAARAPQAEPAHLEALRVQIDERDQELWKLKAELISLREQQAQNGVLIEKLQYRLQTAAMVTEEAQQQVIADWAAEVRGWTTPAIVAINLRTFARTLLKLSDGALRAPSAPPPPEEP